MSVQHWDSLTEAEKLTQSQLVPGVVEQVIKRENLIDRMPVALARGKKIQWLREKVTLDSDVARFSIGDTTNWTSSMQYDEVETALKRCYLARLLNNFLPDVYGTINDYEAQMLWETKKGVYLFLGDRVIYDDTTYGGSDQTDGIHALAAENTGYLNIDCAGAALPLKQLRLMLDAMKQGCDILYMPALIGILFDQAYEERGFAALATGVSGTFSLISKGLDALGKPIFYFAGVPIVRTDYLVAEQNDTGLGSNARAKHTSGTANYSVFGIKFGDLFKKNPGIMMGFGHPDMLNQLYKLTYFDKMPTHVDSKGIELVSYFAPLLGSKLCLGRMVDIIADPITA